MIQLTMSGVLESGGVRLEGRVQGRLALLPDLAGGAEVHGRGVMAAEH